MAKKPKQFRPCKIPRYLIGSVSPQIIHTDLVEYNSHRYKVFTASPRVDTSPPKLNPFNYINVRKLRADADRLKMIDMENKHIVKQINLVNRTIGRVDSYNPQAYADKSKWSTHVLRMKQIEKHNKTIYNNLMAASSGYNAQELNNLWLELIKKIELGCKFPLTILKKRSRDAELLKEPSISCGLEKLAERPMYIPTVVNGPFLGRVEIELYHDHVPVTVQNFLALCTGDNEKKISYKNCPVHRIVPGKFLETGDITQGTGRGGTSIYGDSFPEEGHKLKHTKAGVLSMVRVGKNSNNSIFCITMANMQSRDKQHVVFGRIVKNVEIIFKLEGYGRRIGKPLAPVVISSCGHIIREVSEFVYRPLATPDGEYKWQLVSASRV